MRALSTDEGPLFELRRELARRRMFGDDTPARAVSIGRFEIERELGRGGMGIVYLARDPKLGRRVALKVMRDDCLHVSDTVARARLMREAASMAALCHPNVVSIYDVGECDGGHFVAMEYVDGPNLRAWMRANPAELPGTQAQFVHYMIDAARALHAAHRAGFVHRDFKPENVLVGRDGRARVADFGLVLACQGMSGTMPVADARETYPGDESNGESSVQGGSPASTLPEFDGLTPIGGIAGTPAYMAPEQRDGQSATQASDQFAFCVTLFEGLVGTRPSASSRPLRWPERPRVPRTLRSIVTRGLARKPRDRFDDMQQLADALARWTTRARAGRARVLWVMLGVVLATLLVAFAFALRG